MIATKLYSARFRLALGVTGINVYFLRKIDRDLCESFLKMFL